MSIPSEHKALIFVGAIAILGAGVRVIRASAEPSLRGVQAGLEHQLNSADSSARALHAARAGKRGRGRSGASHAQAADTADDTLRRRRPSTITDSTPRRAPSLLDRRGYVGNRLDLDIATAAQIDSLPGVAPGMAKRIVADRLTRGPFLTMSGLRRVSGVGPAFIQRIDSLVMFSGTIAHPDAMDTVIAKRRGSRAKKRVSGR